MAYDPWAAWNAGNEQLIKTNESRLERERQAPLDASVLKQREQISEQNEINLNNMRIGAQDQLDTRALEDSLKSGYQGSMEPPGDGVGPMAPSQSFDFTRSEKTQARSDLMTQQGDYKGAREMVEFEDEQEKMVLDEAVKRFLQTGDTQQALNYLSQVPGTDQSDYDLIKGLRKNASGQVVFTSTEGDEIIEVKNANGELKYYNMSGGSSKTATGGEFDGDGNFVTDAGDFISAATILSTAKDYLLDQKMPSLGRGAGSVALRQAIMDRSKQWQAELGLSAGQLLAARSEVAGLKKSIAKQEIGIGAAGSYIRNVGKQVTRLSEHILPNLTQGNVKIFNIPLRLWDDKIVGNATRKAYEMYLTEISNEVARLASSSPQSIAELSVQAQEKWLNIHDPDLSPADIKALIIETEHAVNLRYDSFIEERDYGLQRMDEIYEDPASRRKVKVKSASEANKRMPEGAIKGKVEKDDGKVVPGYQYKGKLYTMDGEEIQ